MPPNLWSTKVLVNDTGIKRVGDGARRARKCWVQVRQGHLGMEPTMSDIRAVEFTRNCEGVSTTLTDLLSQIPKGEQICTVPAPVRQIASQPSDGQ